MGALLDLQNHQRAKLAEQQPHLSEGELLDLEQARNATPDKHRYRDLPVSSFADDFDLVTSVRETLRLFESGQFQRPAELADVMTRDDRVNGVLSTRVNALLGRKVSLAPANDSAKAKEVCDALEPLWERMFPLDQLAALQRWAIHLGVAPGELIWSRTPEAWVPTLKVWHPRYLFWRWSYPRVDPEADVDTGFFALVHADGQLDLEPGDGKWVLLTPGGRHQRGWMSGSVRSLAIPWLIRTWAYRDWARYSEVHGQPTRKAIAPSEAKKEDKDRFFREIRDLGSEPTVLLLRNDEGEGFDYELEEAQAKTWDGFEALISKTETSIAIAVLGQNLTTEGGPHVGTADVQDEVRRDYLRADGTSLAGALREQVLRPWAGFNYGDPNLAPIATWDVEPPKDHQASALALETAGGALANLNAALASSGKRVDVEAFAEQFDVPIVDAPIPAPGSLPPLPGSGGGSPGLPSNPDSWPTFREAVPVVGLRSTSPRPQLENKVAVIAVTDHAGRMLWGRRRDDGRWTTPAGHFEPGETPEAAALRELFEESGLRPNGPLVALGRGKSPDGAIDVYAFACVADGLPTTENDPDAEIEAWEWVDVSHGLPAPIAEHLHVPAERNLLLQLFPAFHQHRAPAAPAGAVEGQAYADALVQGAKMRAQRVLDHDIRVLRQEIAASSSAADLRDRLVRRYRSMDARALTQLVEKVLILGELAGRHAAIKDV